MVLLRDLYVYNLDMFERVNIMMKHEIDNSFLNWPLTFAHDVGIVGVINMSPDSYFKNSVAVDIDAAVEMARKHISQGAHFIEIGGLSGGSSAKRISEEEEMDRTIPVINAVHKEFPQVTIIVDTFRSEVARSGLENGAKWINDVTALTYDNNMIDVVREYDATVVIMHLEGPGGHAGRKLNRPYYADVVREVKDFFAERIDTLTRAGIPKEHIIIDLGFGAGKRAAHDYDLFANIDVFKELGCEQMAACSRKLFVEAVSPVPPDERLGGSIVGTLWCVLHGCKYIRVHEVRPYAQALDVWNCIVAKVEGNRRNDS